MTAVPIGLAMSDGTVRPFAGNLGAMPELAARRGLPKSTLDTWLYRSRAGKTIYPFPAPLFALSTGHVWYPPAIDDYRPAHGRWPKTAA